MRIQVANVSRRFPQLLVTLAENRIRLTVAAQLAPHLREENVDKLLSDCAGITKRKVEEYLVELRPKPVFNPSIRKRPSSKGGSDRARAGGQKRTRQEQPKQPGPAASAEVAPSEPPPKPSPNVLEPATTDAYNFRFSADKCRHIPSEVRERVHARAGYQCEYRSKDGTRCSARTGLEIDHERPFGIYRSHDERYLRLLKAQSSLGGACSWVRIHRARLTEKSVRKFPDTVLYVNVVPLMVSG
jgi:hypothetical protein